VSFGPRSHLTGYRAKVRKVLPFIRVNFRRRITDNHWMYDNSLSGFIYIINESLFCQNEDEINQDLCSEDLSLDLSFAQKTF